VSLFAFSRFAINESITKKNEEESNVVVSLLFSCSLLFLHPKKGS